MRWFAAYGPSRPSAIPPNTSITNTATATYHVAGAAQSVSASHTVTTDPASGNSPPTGITLAPNHVPENSPGAAVGALAVVDPDPSDAHTYSVSDPRFEIVAGQLRLVAGTALDFETEPSVALAVTTTDPSGASVTVNLTVIVDNRNEAPTAVALSKATFDANSFGAPVGALTVADPDVGDSHTFAVDDPRFEVVSGTLRLVAAASFPLGGTVTVSVTATDAGGLAHAQSFTLTATPPGSGAGSNASIRILEEAPAVAGLGATDVGATQCGASADPSGPFQAVPTPTSLSGAPLPVPGAVELHGTAVFKTGAPVFVEVIDANANTDPAARETILVTLTTDTGDAETLRLLETSADSGTFAGYVDSVSGPAVAHDCAISGGLHVTLTADYVDAADAADHAVARAMLDPVSRVFVASTGQAVDGASIVLLDGNGAPAHVSGDDGTSAYPAAVASGTDVVDAGGAHYAYAHGEYRFPWLAPGTYQLRVTPPHRFAFPSAASDAAIQSVAGAPYALSDASRGATFTIAVGPSSRVDLPLDLLPITPTRAAIEHVCDCRRQTGRRQPSGRGHTVRERRVVRCGACAGEPCRRDRGAGSGGPAEQRRLRRRRTGVRRADRSGSGSRSIRARHGAGHRAFAQRRHTVAAAERNRARAPACFPATCN